MKTVSITGEKQYVDDVVRILRMHVARGLIKIEDDENKTEKATYEDAKVVQPSDSKIDVVIDTKEPSILDTKEK